MSSDLKRVGLVFNADGSVDFINSLKVINSNLRENYQDFKLVQEQWDKSTTITQKLSDKLNYLNNAYDIQKEKVATLRAELEEAEKSEKRNETEIAKKSAQLKEAEVSLQRYQNQINKTSKELENGTAKLKDYSNGLKESGDKLTSVGKKMSVFSAAYIGALTLVSKSSIEFESAFAGVEKTVNGTAEQLEELKQGIKDLSKEIPATTTEISGVAESAGQLGIQTENILSFTKTMINLGEATNLSADEAATTLARFANVTKMSQSDFDKLGSVIVALGNNFATTESEIAQMGMNLASAGTQVGMSQSEIMSLATALSSVGLEAQAGGTAFSKVMVNMQLAVEKGGDELKDFAKVAGMSTSEFSKLFKEDAASAILEFISGLSKTGTTGKSAIKILDDMGITETRLRDSLLRSANASNIFKDALKLGNTAWTENNALTEEANKRYQTTESRIKIIKNTLNDLAITIGNLILPYIQKFLDKIKVVLNWINNLNPSIQKIILVIGGVVAALGPALLIIGKLATSISSIINLALTIGPTIAGIITTVGPIIAIIAGIVAAIVLVSNAIKELWNTNEGFRTAVSTLFQEIKDSLNNIWVNIISPIIEMLKAAFNALWTETIEPLWNSFKEMISNIVLSISENWSKIKPIFDTIIEILGPVILGAIDVIIAKISAALSILGELLRVAFKFISDIVSSIIKIIGGIADFISGVFTGNWKKALEGVKNVFTGIFSGIASFVKVYVNAAIAIINGLISGINVAIKALNKIKLPDWDVLGPLAGKGINLKTVGKIEYMASGGNLLNGAAVVAEAGPELLLQKGSSTKVVPLTNSSTNTPISNFIDYNKLYLSFLKALNSCKFILDKEGFVRIIDDRLMEVV